MNVRLQLELACEGGGGGMKGVETPMKPPSLALACEGGAAGENGAEKP